jgi:hypothetical protein
MMLRIGLWECSKDSAHLFPEDPGCSSAIVVAKRVLENEFP